MLNFEKGEYRIEGKLIFAALINQILKHKNMYRIIILMFILFYPVLIMASPDSVNTVIKEGSVMKISQDCKLPLDLSVADHSTGNSEVQILILREEIPVLNKTVSSSKFIYSFNCTKNYRNQVSVSETFNSIFNLHSSILFTGVLII